MTWLLSIDPGLNTGIALGFYDATTPYQLHKRWQVHRGTDGFIDWMQREMDRIPLDEIVYEKFVLRSSPDDPEVPNIEGVPIEGLIALMARERDAKLIAQTRAAKGDLIGYSPAATSKAQRQRERFDFLDRFGMFKPGTEFDDSNDAITHALVSLKSRRHIPTVRMMFPPRERVSGA